MYADGEGVKKVFVPAPFGSPKTVTIATGAHTSVLT